MISNHYFYLNIFLLCIGTILIRGSFIAFSSRIKITPKVKDLFTYIPAAIVPALIIPASFFHQGQVALFAGKERLLVLLISSLICYFYRNMLFVIIFGLSLLYLVKFL